MFLVNFLWGNKYFGDCIVFMIMCCLIFVNKEVGVDIVIDVNIWWFLF